MDTKYIVCLSLLWCINLHAEGLLLVKPYDGSNDSAASPIEYKSASRFPNVYNIVSKKGTEERIMTSLIVKDVPYSTVDLPSLVVSDADLSSLQARIDLIKNVNKLWPTTGSLLSSRLLILQEALKKFSTGNVYASGQWIPKSEYLKNIKAENDKLKAAEQKEIEEEKQKQLAIEAQAKKVQEIAEKRREEQKEIAKQKLESEEKIRLAEIEAKKAETEAKKAEDLRIAANLDDKRKKEEDEKRKLEEAELALIQRHTQFVNKYLKDNFVEPTALKNVGDPSYSDTISFINGKLGKQNAWIGFGQSCQRFVLVSRDNICIFNASDFSPEARIAQKPTSAGIEYYVAIEARNSEKKVETIVLHPESPEQIARSILSYQLNIAVENSTDAEKVQKALNHLIQMFGGKHEIF